MPFTGKEMIRKLGWKQLTCDGVPQPPWQDGSCCSQRKACCCCCGAQEAGARSVLRQQLPQLSHMCDFLVLHKRFDCTCAACMLARL